MSWLNLRRLLPPRKAWKVFTNKLQIKLHKLNRSKAVTKLPKSKPYKKYRWPHLSIQPKKFKLKPKSNKLIHPIQKRAPPVYVDHLFIEPVAVVKKRLEFDPPIAALPGESSSETKPCSKRSTNHCGRKVLHPENSDGDASTANDRGPITAADELWESMALNSPQMHGINERAEEFISRFRAQVRHQEMIARRS